MPNYKKILGGAGALGAAGLGGYAFGGARGMEAGQEKGLQRGYRMGRRDAMMQQQAPSPTPQVQPPQQPTQQASPPDQSSSQQDEVDSEDGQQKSASNRFLKAAEGRDGETLIGDAGMLAGFGAGIPVGRGVGSAVSASADVPARYALPAGVVGGALAGGAAGRQIGEAGGRKIKEEAREHREANPDANYVTNDDSADASEEEVTQEKNATMNRFLNAATSNSNSSTTNSENRFLKAAAVEAPKNTTDARRTMLAPDYAAYKDPRSKSEDREARDAMTRAWASTLGSYGGLGAGAAGGAAFGKGLQMASGAPRSAAIPAAALAGSVGALGGSLYGGYRGAEYGKERVDRKYNDKGEVIPENVRGAKENKGNTEMEMDEEKTGANRFLKAAAPSAGEKTRRDAAIGATLGGSALGGLYSARKLGPMGDRAGEAAGEGLSRMMYGDRTVNTDEYYDMGSQVADDGEIKSQYSTSGDQGAGKTRIDSPGGTGVDPSDARRGINVPKSPDMAAAGRRAGGVLGRYGVPLAIMGAGAYGAKNIADSYSDDGSEKEAAHPALIQSALHGPRPNIQMPSAPQGERAKMIMRRIPRRGVSRAKEQGEPDSDQDNLPHEMQEKKESPEKKDESEKSEGEESDEPEEEKPDENTDETSEGSDDENNGSEEDEEKEASVPAGTDSGLAFDWVDKHADVEKNARFNISEGSGGFYITRRNGKRLHDQPIESREKAQQILNNVDASDTPVLNNTIGGAALGGLGGMAFGPGAAPGAVGGGAIGLLSGKAEKHLDRANVRGQAMQAAKQASNGCGEKTAGDSDPCEDGYEQAGMKTKDGEKVPNCIPKEGRLNRKLAGTYAMAFDEAGERSVPRYLAIDPNQKTEEKIASAFDRDLIDEKDAKELLAMKEAFDQEIEEMNKEAAGVVPSGKTSKALMAAGLLAPPAMMAADKAIDPVRERVRYERMKRLPGKNIRLGDEMQGGLDNARENWNVPEEASREEAVEKARRRAFGILHDQAPEVTRSPSVARGMIRRQLKGGEPQRLMEEAQDLGGNAARANKSRQQTRQNSGRAVSDAAQALRKQVDEQAE